MEEYMENAKRLRSQMNDIEEAAAKRSVEEQKQKTVIAALENDLDHARGLMKRLNDDAEEMKRAKASIGSEITEEQKRISSLEIESRTLCQTLELLQQELTIMLLKLKEKRSYYARVTEELNLKVQEQQVWYDSYRQKIVAGSAPVEDCVDKEMVRTEVHHDETCGRYMDLMTVLDSSKTQLDELEAKKSEIVKDRAKSKQLLEELNNRMQAAPPTLREMDFKSLEAEHRSLMADKAGELEYLKSLEKQMNQLKNISYAIKCQCGKEYNVELAS